jgi:hypothetical protein
LKATSCEDPKTNAGILDIASGGINVATVIEGSKRSEDGFEERELRRVTTLGKFKGGGQVIVELL